MLRHAHPLTSLFKPQFKGVLLLACNTHVLIFSLSFLFFLHVFKTYLLWPCGLAATEPKTNHDVPFCLSHLHTSKPYDRLNPAGSISHSLVTGSLACTQEAWVEHSSHSLLSGSTRRAAAHMLSYALVSKSGQRSDYQHLLFMCSRCYNKY